LSPSALRMESDLDPPRYRRQQLRRVEFAVPESGTVRLPVHDGETTLLAGKQAEGRDELRPRGVRFSSALWTCGSMTPGAGRARVAGAGGLHNPEASPLSEW